MPPTHYHSLHIRPSLFAISTTIIFASIQSDERFKTATPLAAYGTPRRMTYAAATKRRWAWRTARRRLGEPRWARLHCCTITAIASAHAHSLCSPRGSCSHGKKDEGACLSLDRNEYYLWRPRAGLHDGTSLCLCRLISVSPNAVAIFVISDMVVDDAILGRVLLSVCMDTGRHFALPLHLPGVCNGSWQDCLSNVDNPNSVPKYG